MSNAIRATAVLAITVAFFAILYALNPFAYINAGMDRAFGAPPSWTQVSNLYLNPDSQDLSHGNNPSGGLKRLQAYWGAHPGADRIVFAGNSQMHTVSLASGEPRPTGPEKTYVDLIADSLAMQRRDMLTYRLSSSGMSYPEVLWELTYMYSKPELRPNTLVLQMNYQAFWTGGIRDGLLPLLEDQTFRKRIDELATSNAAFAPAFEEALEHFKKKKAKEQSAQTYQHRTGPFAWLTANPGYRMETKVRNVVARSPQFQRRGIIEDDFANMLYRGRLYFLHLKPSTARSISGSRLAAARASVEAIVQTCKDNGISVLLFHAPVNPNVSLYRTPQDRESYREFVSDLASRYSVPLYDFENSIPGDSWGHLLNGPDPLHMGRTAHHEFARLMLESLPLNEPAKQR